MTLTVKSRRLLKRGFIDVVARCDQPCRLAARAKLPRLSKKAKQLRTKRRAATIVDASKSARIRLKVSKKTRRKLRATLAKRRRMALRVSVSVQALGGGTAQITSRKVTIRRKRTRAR